MELYWALFWMTFWESLRAGFGWLSDVTNSTIVGIVFTAFLGIIVTNDAAYGRLRTFLSEAGWHAAYYRLLAWGQKRLDGFYGPFTATALFTRALDRCLLLAFGYPVALLLLSWAMGGPAAIAGIPVFPELDNPWARAGVAAAVLAVAGFLFAVFFAHFTNWTRRWLNRRIPAGWRYRAELIPLIDYLVICVAVALALAGAVALTDPGAGTVALAAAGALTGALAGAGAGAGGGAVAVAVAVAIAGAVAGAFAVAAAIAFPVAAAIAIAFPVASALFVLWFLLPVGNALLDWASLLVSRLLLRHLLDRENSGTLRLRPILGLGLVDLAFAVVALVGVAALLPAALASANLVLVALDLPMFDWRPYLDAARESPWLAGLTVTGMLVTTLLPTAAHLLVLALAVATGLLNLNWGWYRRRLEEAAPDALVRLGVVVCFGVALFLAVSMVLVFGCAVYALFSAGLHREFGLWLADAAVWISRAVGDPMWSVP